MRSVSYTHLDVYKRQTLLWVAFRGLFLTALPEWLAGKVWLLYGAGNLVFLLYDWGLSRLIGMMTARLKLR